MSGAAGPRKPYESDVGQAIAFLPVGHDFYTEVKAAELLALLGKAGVRLETARVLDVGCGEGLTDRHLAPALPFLHGVDPSAAAIAAAKRANPGVTYAVGNGATLPHDDGTFHLVFAVCVLHHVAPEGRAAMLAEMARVTRPGGLVSVLDHNPLNPGTRLVVSRCELDHDAVLLRRGEAEGLLRGAGLTLTESRYILAFPWRGAAWRWVERQLAALPLGAQYLVAGQKHGG